MVLKIPYTPSGTPELDVVEFDGVKFKTELWKVPTGTERKGKVVYLHGFAEDSSIYTEFFDKLSAQGYEIFYFGQRGGVESTPKAIGSTNEHHTFKDLDHFIKLNLDAREDKSEKLFLVGHSMGGGIILNYGITGKYIQNIRGIFACAPLVLVAPDTAPNPLVKIAGRVASKIAPGMKYDTNLNFNHLTNNKKWLAYVKEQKPNVVGTLGQLAGMVDRGEALVKKEYVSKFNPDVALSVIHGTDDNINWCEGSKKFFDLLNDNIDKEFTAVQGAKHSLFMERDDLFETVFGKLLDFLNSHS